MYVDVFIDIIVRAESLPLMQYILNHNNNRKKI